MASANTQTIFDVLVVSHVVCAVVGFGAVMLSGVYGFSGRRRTSPEALEETRRYFRSPGRLELLVVAVPFLGLAAVIVQPGGHGPAQLWTLLAALVWLVAVGVLFGVARPAERRVRAALAGPEAGGLDLGALASAGTRLGWGGLVSDAAFVAGFVLMILQPR